MKIMILLLLLINLFGCIRGNMLADFKKTNEECCKKPYSNSKDVDDCLKKLEEQIVDLGMEMKYNALLEFEQKKAAERYVSNTKKVCDKVATLIAGKNNFSSSRFGFIVGAGATEYEDNDYKNIIEYFSKCNDNLATAFMERKANYWKKMLSDDHTVFDNLTDYAEIITTKNFQKFYLTIRQWKKEQVKQEEFSRTCKINEVVEIYKRNQQIIDGKEPSVYSESVKKELKETCSHIKN